MYFLSLVFRSGRENRLAGLPADDLRNIRDRLRASLPFREFTMKLHSLLLLTLSFSGVAYATEPSEIMPASGIKSPFSAPAVPTDLKPLTGSLASYLNQGYQIVTSSVSGSELLLTLSHRGGTLLCALTPPDLRNDQNIATSRCWTLNSVDSKR